MSFSMETEKENKLSFLDVDIIREQGKFTIKIHRKPTFTGVYSNFESFLPSVYKFDIVYTLVYRCFCICSNWTYFHTELAFLKGIILKNGSIENLMTNVLKSFYMTFILLKKTYKQSKKSVSC